jgi:type VI secretion system protein ImpM
MTGDESRIPGWYGKIPNLGDFASRRLPSRFIVPWDDWLQRTLAGTRALLGEAWLNAYLTSPLWRFLLMPEVCGNTGWAGVLMPSVDRVGRYFPLSIAIELPLVPCREGQFDALSRWLEGVEHAALATLDLDHTAEDLDRALGAIPLPVLGAPQDSIEVLQQRLADRLVAHSAPPTVLTLPSLDSFASLLCGAGTRILLRAAIGKSLWWSRNREGGSPLMLCCEGLPAPDDFALLLNGGALERLQASAN